MGHELWFEQLAGDLPAGYGQDLTDFLDRVYGSGQIYPPRELVFAALDRTSLEAVRVVILGQDPYHGPGQAQGLAFSVPDHLPAPPSLRNILKELEADIGRRDHHDLTSWADQGVLLLNSCLTVPQHEPNGHAGLIWETLTDAIIRLVNRKRDPVVFILWGGPARKKKRLISSPQHLVLESAHPSPLSSYRGFFGSRSFSQTNAFLENQGLGTIDWLR